MQITRYFTRGNESGLIENAIAWKTVPVRIEEKGKVILDMPSVEVPEHWSQSAAQILAHKYFRKAGVPAQTKVHPLYTHDTDVPDFLKPRVLDTADITGAEGSAKQVFHRLAGHWAFEGLEAGYFNAVEARRFYDEIYYMLAMQMAAPNSPQWFNTGIWWAYGIEGAESGCFTSRGIGQDAEAAPNTYRRPQTSACFILGLRDSLLDEGGILDTVKREGRIFKFGSGSGVNYSSLRAKGAQLSNGGTSSGMMSFLKLFDTNAGTIKSGGTTRRAARMAIVDCDHPEAEAFVEWKAREEAKVSAMVAGARATTAENAPSFIKEVRDSLQAAEYEGEAYTTISGQNANNSLRVTEAFMTTVSGEMPIASRRNGKTGSVLSQIESQTDANRLWQKTCEAAWLCGDPGLQFHDTINKWHTIPKVAPQRATNPCSEYSFIDDSSCNLASLNLLKFVKDTGDFDVKGFTHACTLWTIVLDISVGMSSYPDKNIAENSVNYRAIGLGYANLGGLLMAKGVPYDSEEGRAIAGIITGYMHGTAWNTSQALANTLGAFKDYDTHADDVNRVLELHRSAAVGLLNSRVVTSIEDSESYSWIKDLTLDFADLWLNIPYKPLRNAQLTLLAPTGTIGLVMDCATTGVEPDFSLVKYKKLAGGGTMTLTNQLIVPALETLGYDEDEISEIVTYIRTIGKVDLHCPVVHKTDIRVFDCAGDISVDGHIGMMAAVQPFLSGAISKTVNMPATATVADVSAAYMKAWKLGLKAIAIYRDGCKLSQPLTALVTTSTSDSDGPKQVSDDVSGATTQKLEAVVGNPSAPKRVSGARKLSPRYKLPNRRSGFTQKVRIGNQSLYLRTGEYSDGKIGEVFVTYGRDGSTMRHLMDAIAISMSLGLQHGVPLQEYVDAFTDTRAEPSGLVIGSDSVRMCTSIMDYIVRELGAGYLPKEAELDVPPSIDSPTGPEIEDDFTVSDPELDSGALGEKSAAKHASVADLEYAKQNVATKPVLTVVGGKSEGSSGGTEPVELVSGLRTLAAASRKGAVSVAAVSAAVGQPRYSGNACPSCGSFTLRRAGSCHVCDSCGETTGCS